MRARTSKNKCEEHSKRVKIRLGQRKKRSSIWRGTFNPGYNYQQELNSNI